MPAPADKIYPGRRFDYDRPPRREETSPMTPPRHPAAPPPARWCLTLLFALAFAFAPAGAARGATPEEVDKAIKDAKTFLYSQQNKAGHWDTEKPAAGHAGSQWGGWT